MKRNINYVQRSTMYYFGNTATNIKLSFVMCLFYLTWSKGLTLLKLWSLFTSTGRHNYYNINIINKHDNWQECPESIASIVLSPWRWLGAEHPHCNLVDDRGSGCTYYYIICSSWIYTLGIVMQCVCIIKYSYTFIIYIAN